MITIDISHTLYTSNGIADLLIQKTFHEGDLVFLSGASGIGKTTFFRILAGLVKPDYGYLRIGDKRHQSFTSTARYCPNVSRLCALP